MNFYTLILLTATFTIQQYADYYKEKDLRITLEELKHDYGIPRVRTWDYIVVGGGSAGCILAEQLSKKHSVLLIEKGGDPVPETYNKEHIDMVYTHPGINDVFTSWKQSNAFGANNGVDTISVGRMLGGTASHNTMIYNRGAPQDFDNWANLTGDPSLRYENMLQYFKQVENFNAELVDKGEETKYYGHQGPVWITSNFGKDFQLWIAAAKELGFKVKDPNGYQSPSFTPANFNFHNGLRHSSYIAFILDRAANRHSLTILKYSDVQHILIHKDKRAYGVVYYRHGIPQVAHARKEVILSAGAIGSASLLIKSGIGPKQLLNEAGIPLVEDVPGVGARYMEHPVVFLNFSVTNVDEFSRYFATVDGDKQVQEDLVKFHKNDRHREGVFASHLIMRGQSFLVSKHARDRGESDWSDYVVWLRYAFRVNPEIPEINFAVLLGRPLSVGKLMFDASLYKQGERDDVKLIRPDENYFGDPKDLDIMVEGINFALKVKDTKVYKPFGFNFSSELPPQCNTLKFGSDEYWKCFIVYVKTSLYNVAHRSVTCRMGNLEKDPLAVVDKRFRVRGIKGLRIVDTGVFPHITNANTNAPVMALAMKAASHILQDA